MKSKKTKRKRVRNYSTTVASSKRKSYNSSSRKSMKKKKIKLNKFKMYRNLFFIFIIVALGLFIHNYFIQKSITQQQVAIEAQQRQKADAMAKENAEKRSEFFNKENKILSDLQRYNENIELSMNYESALINIYPDSLNAVNTLKSNLTTYSQYLTSSELTNINSFLSNLASANTTYINAILAYNKIINSSSSNIPNVKTQKSYISSDFTTLNNLISQNKNIFINK